MEFIIEFVMELIVEGSIEVSKNKKVSKWIRYPLILLIVLFFSIIIFGLIFLGIIVLEKNILAGILFMIIGIILLLLSIKKAKKFYNEIKNEK